MGQALKKNGGNWDDWKLVGHALLEGDAQRPHHRFRRLQ